MTVLLTFLTLCLIVWIIILQDKISSLQKEVKRTKKIIKYNIELGVIQKRPQKQTEPPVQELLPEVTPQAEQSKDINFEKLFLENIFNKIGAIALIIGLAIFIKIIAPYFIFTPVIKILLGTIFAAATLFTGLKLNKKELLKKYSEVLIGIGQAALFITLYCATSLYALISTPVATVLAILFTGAGFYLADRMKTTSSLWLIMFAGYLNPYFINNSFTEEYLLCYLIILNTIGLAFVHKNPDKFAVNIVNIFMTTLLIGQINNFTFETIYAKSLLIGMVIVYAVLTYFYKTKEDKLFETYLNSTLITLAICTLAITSGIVRPLLLTFEGLGAAYFSKTNNNQILKLWMQIFFGIAALFALFQNFSDVHQQTLIYLVLITSMLVSSRYCVPNEDKTKTFLEYLSIALGFFCIHENAVYLKNLWSAEYLISILWVLYAGIITTCGILKKHKVLTYSGIVLCLLTTFRIFLFDLGELSSIYKTIAFFALGVVLMIVSYIYTKRTK